MVDNNSGEKTLIKQKIERIKEIYSEFCSLINSLKEEQNKIVKEILTRSEQEEMKRLIKKMGEINNK